MRHTEWSSDVLFGHWAMYAKAAALITVQPDTAGPIDPDPATAPLNQLIHGAAMTALIEAPDLE